MESRPVAWSEQSPRNNNKYLTSSPHHSILSTCLQFHVCSFKSCQSFPLPHLLPLRAGPLQTLSWLDCGGEDDDINITSHGWSRCGHSDQHFYKYQILIIKTCPLWSPDDAGLLSRGEAQQSLQPVITEESLVGAETEAESNQKGEN